MMQSKLYLHSVILISMICLSGLNNLVCGQTKSELKKYGIKTIRITNTENETTYTERTEVYNKAGLPAEITEYSPDGKIRKRTTYKYDRKGALTEEAEYKGSNLRSRIVYELNGPENKISKEFVYDADNLLKTTKSIVYNNMGDKTEEIIMDRNGSLIQKLTYAYDKNGMKTERITLDSNGNIIQVRKYIYE